MPSGGDAVSGFGGGVSLVAVVCVAVADVAGEGVAERVPVEVVGVADDELAERGEVALDRVEVAGVGRRRDKLDPVVGGVGADRWHPVGREVVLDPVDALPGRVGEPDLTHEGEHVAAGAFWSEPDPEPVGVDVVGAEDVADAGAAVVVGPLPLRPSLRRPAGARGRAQTDRPHLVEAHDRPVCWRRLAERKDPRRLRLIVGIGAGFQVRVRWNERPASASSVPRWRGETSIPSPARWLESRGSDQRVNGTP
jgi:hypothetical protein